MAKRKKISWLKKENKYTVTNKDLILDGFSEFLNLMLIALVYLILGFLLGLMWSLNTLMDFLLKIIINEIIIK